MTVAVMFVYSKLSIFYTHHMLTCSCERVVLLLKACLCKQSSTSGNRGYEAPQTSCCLVFIPSRSGHQVGKLWLVGQAIFFFFQRTRWCWMRTVSVFSSQANLPLSDINRQDNKTLRAQFGIIFSNQRLISCQFAFTLPRM